MHNAYVTEHLVEIKRPKIENRFRRMIDEKIRAHILEVLKNDDTLNNWIQEIISGNKNPYTALGEFDKQLNITWEN
jgi:hypothetical protein